VTDFIVPTWNQKELLRLAASLEHRPEHPLTQAIGEHVTQQSLSLEDPQNFTSSPGQGVRGTIAGQAVIPPS